MAINKKLIHFKKKETFDRELSAGNILDTSIVFIQDAKMIWTHGTLYPCPFTIEELKEFVKNNTIYQTDLPDDLVMPNTVGGIKANTKVSDLEGDSFSQMFDNLLFPEIQPTIQNPSSGISFKNSFSSGGIYEVGATSPTVENLNGTFNRGTCTVVGQSNKYRAGGLDNENSWFYYGGTVTNKTFPEKITLGTMSYYYHASYSEGDVLVTSKGNKANVSPNPLTAGSVNSGALSIYGTYPYYCNGASGSTSSQETSFPTSVSPNTKLPLKKWTDTLIGVKFASEATTGTRLYFEYPSSKTISKVEFFNTVSGKWEVFGTDKYIVSSSGNKTIQGNQIAYSKLTTQGALSGALQLRFTVSNTVKTLSDEPYTYEGEEITDEVINYIKKNSDINPFEAIDKVNYDISLLASDTDRATGVASFAVNFEPGGQSPLDARTLVPTKSSLINTESYKNKNYYKGMMVIVEDTQEIYILKDISKISSTDYSGWKRVDVGAQTVTEIINNLTSTSTSAALSANMGKHLQDTKLNKSDVINNLTTTDSSKALSASQGKVLNDKILAIGNAYRVKGSKTNLSEVLSITNAKVGDVWNITTEFTLHGKPFPASTNLVCITDTSESDHDEDNWDPLGGTVDLTPYATKSEVSNTYATKSEVAETYATKEEVEENEKVTAESLVDLNSKLEDNETKIDTHISNKSNPHSVTKAHIGLGNVTNESKATMFTNAALTGTPTAPTAGSGTNSTQIATTAFVQTEINNKIAASDAMIYKGTIGSTGATITSLPASHKTGWTYKVITAGTYAGQKCEIGDMIICLTDGSTATDSHWTVVQANIDGVVTGPSSAVDKRVAIFNGTTGKLIADSGFTIGKSVPSNAVFTDTTYNVATSSSNGLMSSSDKAKLDGITASADPNQNAFSNITIGSTTISADNPTDTLTIVAGSNVSLSTSGNTVTISSTNTTYGLASTSSNGLLRQLNGNTSQFMRGDGNWGTPINTTYSQATSSTLGLVKIGFPESGQNYPVELNSSGQMFVNVPWTDTNTVPQFQIYAGTTDITNNTNAAGFSGTPKLKLNTDSNEQHAILFQGGAGVNVTIGGNGTNKYIQAGINSSTFKSSIVPTIFTGAISGLIDTNLTSSRALISNTSGKISASSVTSTQLGYLNGVTSSIQTQLNTIKANCIYRGVCSTSADTAAKTVSVDGDFTLTAGVFVAIRFEHTNAASNPTLNVNNTGAKAIFYRGAAWKTSQDPARQYDTILMTYDGTQWMISALLEPNKVNFSDASSTLRAKNFNLDTSTSSNGTITRTSGIQDLYFDSDILSTTSGLFPHSSNANACITVKTNSGNYYHQIGLSSNKKMYARSFQNVVPNSTTSWYTIPYCEDSQDWTGYQDFQSGAGNTGSDMRFKEKKNEEIDNILPDLMNLKVFEYIWRKEGEREKDTFGVSANQLLEFGGVFEKIVHEREDKEKTKWVEYDRIGVLTLKGLQETNKKLEEKCKKYESALKILGEKLGIDLNDLLDNNED